MFDTESIQRHQKALGEKSDAFHAHLDLPCEQCRNQPFNLCLTGQTILTSDDPKSVHNVSVPTNQPDFMLEAMQLDGTSREDAERILKTAESMPTLGPIIKALRSC